MKEDIGELVAAQNPGLFEPRAPSEFRQGRLVFRFPTADEEAAIFKPKVCTCSGPCITGCSGCNGCNSCSGGSCLAVTDRGLGPADPH